VPLQTRGRNRNLRCQTMDSRRRSTQADKEAEMPESVYKVIELVGTSTESWEKAAGAAVKQASKSLRNLRVAEISELDMVLKDGKVESYRAKVKVSFKFEGS
jgi:dodecin